MCGRYVLKTTVKKLAEVYSAIPQGELGFRPVYNVAPTLEMPVVYQQNGDRVIETYRWGLVPHWSKGPDSRYSMINARSESLSEKPAFRDAYTNRRCIVPASGFYEWKNTPDGKIPYFIYPADGDLFSFAGLYERWQADTGQTIYSYTIITTPANEPIESIHERMPAILFSREVEAWMDPANKDSTALKDLLHPAPDDAAKYYPISTSVNNPRNNDPSILQPKQDLFS